MRRYAPITPISIILAFRGRAPWQAPTSSGGQSTWSASSPSTARATDPASSFPSRGSPASARHGWRTGWPILPGISAGPPCGSIAVRSRPGAQAAAHSPTRPRSSGTSAPCCSRLWQAFPRATRKMCSSAIYTKSVARARAGYLSGTHSQVSTGPMNLDEYLDTVISASTELAMSLAGRGARLLVLIDDFHVIASRPLGGWLLNLLSRVREANVVLLHQELRDPAAVELPPGAVALPLGNLSRADVEAYLQSHEDIGPDVTRSTSRSGTSPVATRRRSCSPRTSSSKSSRRAAASAVRRDDPPDRRRAGRAG